MATRISGELQFEAGVTFANATVFIRLQDVSVMDRAAEELAALKLTGVTYHGQAFPFSLDVPVPIDERYRYRVSAHVSLHGTDDIQAGDYLTTQAHSVLTHGHGTTVTLKLKRV